MESWQKQNVKTNLSELIDKILCHAVLLGKLQSEDILSNEDVAKLKSKGDRFEEAKYLLDVLQTRVNGYNALLKSLQKTKQTGALEILLKDLPTNFLQNSKMDLNGRYFLLGNLLDKTQIFNLWGTLDVLERVNFVVDNLEQKTLKLVKNIIPPRVPYYIPRNLSKRLRLNKNIFAQNCPDIFVIDGIDRPKLTEIAFGHKTAYSRDQIDEVTVRFIQLENITHWNYLRDLADAPIHLLKYYPFENMLVLEGTSGGSKILTHFLEKQNQNDGSVVTEGQLIKDIENEAAICICDSPGMGKTLLLASLAQHVSQDLKSLPVFIRLQHFIRNMKSNTIGEAPSLTKLELFNYVTTSAIGARILTKAVESYKINAHIFFDEFDEIDQQDLVYAKVFLRSLAAEANIRIYVASRPHVRHELEETLGVIAYDILPFDEENQIDFLTEYWTIQNTKFSLNLSHFAEICLKDFKRNIASNERDLAGIPLQCRLIAEVQSKSAQRYSETSKDIPNDTLVDFGKSMFEMFNKFVNIKFNIEDNFHTKQHTQSFKKSCTDGYQTFNQKLRIYHHCLAMHVVFPESAKTSFLQNPLQDCQAKQAIISCGLMEEVYNGNEFLLQFIHKTVAEYLAAEYIVSQLTTEIDYTSTDCNSQTFYSCFSSSDTKWDFFWTIIFRDAFKVHRIKRSNITKRSNLCTFTNSTVLYFLDHQLKTFPPKTALRLVRSIAKNMNSTEMYEILISCGYHNFENIFAFTETLYKSNLPKYRTSLIKQNICELISVFCEYSSRELVVKCVTFVNTLYSITLDELFLNFNAKQVDHTPLEYACKRHSYDLLEYFLSKNCSTKGKFLLHILTENSVDLSPDIIQRLVIPMVRLLLYYSPDLINELDAEGKTCLLVNRSSFYLIKILLQNGANLNQRDDNGNTFAHKISEWMSADDFHYLSVFLTEDRLTRKIYKLKNSMGNTPLHCALFDTKSLRADTVQLIVKSGEISVNETNKENENLLISAVKGRQNVEILRVLIELGADYKVHVGKSGWNLLHVAADTGNLEVFYYLLTFGINHRQKDRYGRTPFHIINTNEVNSCNFVDKIVDAQLFNTKREKFERNCI